MYFYWDIYLLMWFCVLVLCPFITPCRTSLCISCSAGLVVTDSFFYLPKNDLSSPLLLKDSFPGYMLLGWQVFIYLFILSLCTLTILARSLLASKVFDEDSNANIIEDLLYVKCCFFPSPFKTFSVFWKFDYNVSLCRSLWVHQTSSSLSFFH